MCRLFWFLGVFLAKTLQVTSYFSPYFHGGLTTISQLLQDNRLVDLPLSYPFLKLLCGGEVSAFVKEKSKIVQEQQQQQQHMQQQQQAQDDELMASSMYSALSEESDLDTTNSSSYAGSCCSSAAGPFGRTVSTSSSSAGAAAAVGKNSWFSHLLSLEDLAQVRSSIVC